MRLLPLAALLVLSSCPAPPSGHTAALPAAAPAPSAPADAPLPGVDEVPAFLQGARAVALPRPPAAVPEVPRAEDPMAGVTVSDGEGGDSFAYATDGEENARDEAAAQPEPAEEPAAPDSPTAAADPCADIKEAIQFRDDYLNRVSSERDRFGFLNGKDASALRLLEGLRRCKAHPDDPDCQPPSIEVDVSQLEKQAAAVERDPDELVSDGTDSGGVLQDPVMVDLDRRLRTCQNSQVAQPLLQRAKAD